MDRRPPERPDSPGWAVYRFGTAAMLACGEDGWLVVAFYCRGIFVVLRDAAALARQLVTLGLAQSIRPDKPAIYCTHQTTHRAVFSPLTITLTRTKSQSTTRSPTVKLKRKSVANGTKIKSRRPN